MEMEKNNIFEGAKFGEKFVTKDGTIVKYVFRNGNDFNVIFIPKCKRSIEMTIRYNDKGEYCLGNGEYGHPWLDIVSKYHEEIDEEKLDELARKEYEGPLTWPEEYNGGEFANKFVECFKTGYRKAKEE